MVAAFASKATTAKAAAALSFKPSACLKGVTIAAAAAARAGVDFKWMLVRPHQSESRDSVFTFLYLPSHAVLYTYIV